ncbi:MAG: hypothetical protein JWO86_5077, partial [Myxococcaceae bacterium]|nr:hypothetical protein [Myxococcaceae bacterium]
PRMPSRTRDKRSATEAAMPPPICGSVPSSTVPPTPNAARGAAADVARGAAGGDGDGGDGDGGDGDGADGDGADASMCVSPPSVSCGRDGSIASAMTTAVTCATATQDAASTVLVSSTLPVRIARVSENRPDGRRSTIAVAVTIVLDGGGPARICSTRWTIAEASGHSGGACHERSIGSFVAGAGVCAPARALAAMTASMPSAAQPRMP